MYVPRPLVSVHRDRSTAAVASVGTGVGAAAERELYADRSPGPRAHDRPSGFGVLRLLQCRHDHSAAPRALRRAGAGRTARPATIRTALTVWFLISPERLYRLPPPALCPPPSHLA